MKSTLTFLIVILIYSTAFTQWNSLNTGLLGQKDYVEKDGTYFLINYPNGVRATMDLNTLNPVNNGLPVSGSNIFAESLGKSSTHVFCGTHDGVYRSDDYGANWTLSNANIPFSSTEFVKKFYEFNGDMYAVMNSAVVTGGGVYISTNSGNTWFGTAGGMGGNATIFSIMEFNDTLYANTDVGLYTSGDWGADWTAHPHFNYGVFAFWANVDVMVASTTVGMERSIDGGNNWTTVTGPTGLTNSDAIGVLGSIYISGSGSSQGVWISPDDGLTWIGDNTGISAVDQTTLYQFYLGPDKLFLGAITEGYFKGIPLSVPNTTDASPSFNSYFDVNSDAIAIRYTGTNSGNASATLYGLTGRKIEVLPLENVLSKFQTTGLNTGIYIVQVNIDQQNIAVPIKVVVP